jgi:hypothetical protein
MAETEFDLSSFSYEGADSIMEALPSWTHPNLSHLPKTAFSIALMRAGTAPTYEFGGVHMHSVYNKWDFYCHQTILLDTGGSLTPSLLSDPVAHLFSLPLTLWAPYFPHTPRESQSWLSTWLDWGAPKRLLEHTSGCICEEFPKRIN